MNESTPLLKKPKFRWFIPITIGLLLLSTTLFTGYSTLSAKSSFLDLNLRIYTNNIRYDNRNPVKHEPFWEIRKEGVSDSIQFNTVNQGNIVCLQEVLHNQLCDILDHLNGYKEKVSNSEIPTFTDNSEDQPNGVELTEETNESMQQNDYVESIDYSRDPKKGDWTYFGVGRTDGKRFGEYAPILYKSSEWIFIDGKTFWLSETPEFPSRSWDAALERIVTMVTLQSRINPMIKLNFFNTHFDHKGVEARRKSSKLIAKKMENYNSYPSFLCGDFNTEPSDEPYHILTTSGFKDARLLSLNQYGYKKTFTNFGKNDRHSIIDYIWSPSFSSNKKELIKHKNWLNYSITIKNFAILTNYFHYFFSDHRPVVADYVVGVSL